MAHGHEHELQFRAQAKAILVDLASSVSTCGYSIFPILWPMSSIYRIRAQLTAKPSCARTSRLLASISSRLAPKIAPESKSIIFNRGVPVDGS